MGLWTDIFLPEYIALQKATNDHCYPQDID
jgi:hypothetical protein